MAAQVRSQSAVVDSVTVSGYVSRVSNKLAAVLRDRGLRVRVHSR
jgi:hypothetical protein